MTLREFRVAKIISAREIILLVTGLFLVPVLAGQKELEDLVDSFMDVQSYKKKIELTFKIEGMKLNSNLPLCFQSETLLQQSRGKCLIIKEISQNEFYYGEVKDKKFDGIGVLNATEYTYAGEWKNGKKNGIGKYIYKDGKRIEGIWGNDKFIRENKINFSKPSTTTTPYEEQSSEERKRSQFKKNPSNQTGSEKLETKLPGGGQNINLQITQPSPVVDGKFTINIETNADTASLKINGEEHGGRSDGKYSINKVARAGQETVFTIVATDINGNTDTKTITVNRPVVESQAKFTPLNPAQITKQPERDAVAIIIGIADYKNLPRAEFANDDASVFYDYAVRALGIKPENIKLLVDANADEVAIYQAFKTWLPSRVRSTTDVYVYYSGHGLPAEDGKELYLLPQQAHRDLIEKTAISQKEINGFIQAARPLSVTIFLDSCYSGLARSGETLIASARPVAIKAEKTLFPDSFAVFSASQNDQISSSSPDLKHGIFSYYLMRGMEGEADSNRDGKITLGEMQIYLLENVGRQAAMMNRKQEPQVIGDVNRILVGM